ncbi:MAG: choice-of-anchor D domain-containing protein [Verrucomicrobiae bacterium]|nr:choice-of-anchor D domain-containing protein [Verrucomicrobiae bacterium]MCP5549655.1 choice-of-anchor D domain-containing protein [Akkermansiaceae bacterium]
MEASASKRAARTGFLAVALFVVAAAASAQDPKSLGIPAPRAFETKAVKGESVSIELSAEARTDFATVEFLIRDFPLNGELGLIESNEKNRTRATVAYQAFRDSAATSDSFTYAVRYPPNGLWSKEVTVKIELEDSLPRIYAPASVDFGRVMIGQSVTREIYISNSGKAPYQQQLSLSTPFALVEPAGGNVHLPVGGGVTLKVRFSPEAEGDVTRSFPFFPNPGGITKLLAQGYAPFAVETPDAALRWEEKTRTRLGEIRVVSLADKPIALNVVPGERLQIGGGLTRFLQPQQSASIAVYLPSTDSGAFSGQVSVGAGTFRRPVSVTAETPPAYLVVENTVPGETPLLDFGAFRPGDVGQSSFLLKNVGGATARAVFEVGPPFAILAASNRATLDPQESEAFAVRFDAPRGPSATHEQAIRVDSDSGQTLQVRLKAVVINPDDPPQAPASTGAQTANLPPAFGSAPDAMPPRPGSAPAIPANQPRVPPSDRPPSPPVGAPSGDNPPLPDDLNVPGEVDDKFRSPLGFITWPLVERQISPNLAPVPAVGIKLVDDGLRHLGIAWPMPDTGPADYEIEMRAVRTNPENYTIESVWAPYHDVEFERGRDTVRTTIRGLNPNTTYEFRVFTLGSGGLVSEPLAFAAATRRPMDWTWIYLGTGIAVFLTLFWLVWRRHQRLYGED